jgi:hypothetical protein
MNQLKERGQKVSERFVYFVQETVKDREGNFIVCVAFEGKKGYRTTDWTWGKDRLIAEQCAEEKNTRMGIDKKETARIIVGTMQR